MSISPFSVRPVPPHENGSPREDARRTRLVLAIATLGIAATLFAYAISPGVRHAVGHAAHSVKHAVSNVFDHDRDKGTGGGVGVGTPARVTGAGATGGTPAARAGSQSKASGAGHPSRGSGGGDAKGTAKAKPAAPAP